MFVDAGVFLPSYPLARSGWKMKRAWITGYVSLIAVPAFACICVPPPSPAKWYAIHHGQPTFAGLAMSVDTVPDVLRQGGGKPILDAEGNAMPVTVEKVVFRAEEPFEGIKTEYVEVYGSGTTCDYHLSAGTRYLVYGWLGEDGKIRTAKCTRTGPLSEVDKDLRFLRSRKSRRRFPR